MKNRVKELRQHLKMTQEEFAKSINLSRSNVSNIELGRISINDRLAKDLCRVYNLNENWLRTGTGEMFNHVDETILAEFLGRALQDDNKFIKHTLMTLSKLNDQEWSVVENLIKQLAKE